MYIIGLDGCVLNGGKMTSSKRISYIGRGKRINDEGHIWCSKCQRYRAPQYFGKHNYCLECNRVGRKPHTIKLQQKKFAEFVAQHQQRKELIMALKDAGYSYRDIASHMGISRQRVHQLIEPTIRERKAVYKRDGYRCQLCNTQGSDARQLDIHHIRYTGLLDDMITLCTSCHRIVENILVFIDQNNGTADAVFDRLIDIVLETHTNKEKER